jgi:predicted hotdog family 3-hydroxylacyl-ACP dehydratase
MKAVFTDADLFALIPQRPPIVMVDLLQNVTESEAETGLLIKEDNIFVSDGVFSAPGLVENIAQTCAARIGYVNKYILKKGIQLGFIGAIRNLEIVGCPKVGDVITTCVTVIDDVLGMTLANGVVTCNGETLATTEIKIAVKEAE